ncbi:MAG: glycosyltransferase [Bacillota bacterium]|nr:glycosyltransferase [Bacillota bacterium]
MYKVLQVSSDTNIGGAGKVLLTYLDAYDKKKFNVSVVMPRGSLLKAPVSAKKARIIEIDGMRDKSLDPSAIRILYKLFKKEKPDIVHTHASLSARIAARLAGVPAVVYTRHSLFTPTGFFSKGLGKAFNAWLNNSTTDAVIAVADAAKDELISAGVKPEKVHVVLNGVAPLRPIDEKRRDQLRKKFGIGKDEKSAAIIGRLSAVKGHEYFVEAARLVLEKGIKAKFLIAGTGEREAELKELVKAKGLEESVLFTGFLENIGELVNCIDIEVNSSLSEATSLALIEAMSLGKPCVVTDAGGNRGVVENEVCGYVVPVGDPYALADKITLLFTDNEIYNMMSINSRSRYENDFTARAMTASIEQVYVETLNKKSFHK